MPKISAGLVMYRVKDGRLQVLLVHPGGPFWRKKDDGVWSIPKGEVAADEDIFSAARREFQEETGIKPEGRFIELGSITQERQDCSRLGIRGRLRHKCDSQQHIYARVASAFGTQAGVSRD
jgi:predicted NUDIX family NTP pyrophosphohydrolase